MIRAVMSRLVVVLVVAAALGCCGCGKSSMPVPRQVHREKWGYMNRAGQLVIKPLFDEVTAFHEGAAAVRVGAKWGFVDARGNLVISATFLAPSKFSEGIACVMIKKTSHDTEDDHSGDWNEMTYVDKAGKHLFSLRAVCYDICDGLAAFGTGFNPMDGQPTKWNYVNRTGKVLLKHDFGDASSFSEGLASVGPQRGKWGYIDTKGRFVIRPPFDSGGDFHEGLASVTANGKTGYIDKRGKAVVRPRFDDGSDFHCGRAMVIYRGKYGYIDRMGVMRIKPTFDEAADFSEGVAKYRDTRTLKWGYIDTNGDVKIRAEYDDALSFHEGLALVRISDKWGYVDKKGTMIIVRPRSSHEYMAYDETTDEEWSFSEGLVPFPIRR